MKKKNILLAFHLMKDRLFEKINLNILNAASLNDVEPLVYKESKKMLFKQLEAAIENQSFLEINKLIEKNPEIIPYFSDDKYTYQDIINKNISQLDLDESKVHYINADFQEGKPNKLTRQEHIDVFLKYINVESFFNKEKVTYLKKIYEDAMFLAKVLAPLEKFVGYITIDLTGGCVRDFVLNRADKIKDLDIMVSLNSSPYKNFSDIDKEKFENMFTKEELQSVNWSYENNADVKREHMILLCLNKYNIKKEVFSIKERRYSAFKRDYNDNNAEKEMYSIERLISVIKLDKGNNNYPIDILLTDFSKPEFLSDFDFDICKASICIKNDNVNINLPEHFTMLLHRFNALHKFWFDVAHKVITYNTLDRGAYNFHASFGKDEKANKNKPHFDRIKEKYPDHELLVVHKDSLDLSKDMNPDIFKKVLHKLELERTLSKKEDIKENPRPFKI